MAIASKLTPSDVNTLDLRVSNASILDVEFYDRAAYRRMDQLTKGEQDGLLIATLFPKASIELLTALELSWWPPFAAQHGVSARTYNGDGTSTTAFDPDRLMKMNQTLIQLEVYKAVEIFYSTIVTDSANVNEKDAANYKYCVDRFAKEWKKALNESFFYDVDGDGNIESSEENLEIEDAFYTGDRRYF